MTVIVCIEDRGGMLFMKRRLSKDRILTENVAETVGDGILYISEFSEALFSDSDISVMSVSNPLISADEGDFVFIENLRMRGQRDKRRRQRKECGYISLKEVR